MGEKRPSSGVALEDHIRRIRWSLEFVISAFHHHVPIHHLFFLSSHHHIFPSPPPFFLSSSRSNITSLFRFNKLKSHQFRDSRKSTSIEPFLSSADMQGLPANLLRKSIAANLCICWGWRGDV